jgi:hypothetical protein
VVLLAGRGFTDRVDLTREQIAQSVGRSRQFVDEWVGRYRTGGIGALARQSMRSRMRHILSRDIILLLFVDYAKIVGNCVDIGTSESLTFT